MIRLRGYLFLILLVVVALAMHNQSAAQPGSHKTNRSSGKAPRSAPAIADPAAAPPDNGDQAHGADISNNNGHIDFDTLAGQASFLYIKASEGGGFQDPDYQSNAGEARAHGIAYGAYHFFRPSRSVDDQVKNFLDAMGPMQPGELPPMLDLEFAYKHEREWLDLPVDERARLVLDWLHKVECATGVTPVVYVSASFAQDVLGAENYPEFAHYPLFVASWDRDSPRMPQPWSTWHFWQYTVDGGLSFVESKHLDRDVVKGGKQGLAALAYDGRRACA
jgi:GH25 family lysozyme M1 (1,4-beta-N-acetylmuramidase)